jgi:REP-associated tyrosine transposase
MRRAGKRGCRALFRHPLDAEALGDIRLALSQRPTAVGNARFLDTIERVIGHRREAKPRGRPRVERTKGEGPDGQVQIELK